MASQHQGPGDDPEDGEASVAVSLAAEECSRNSDASIPPRRCSPPFLGYFAAAQRESCILLEFIACEFLFPCLTSQAVLPEEVIVIISIALENDCMYIMVLPYVIRCRKGDRSADCKSTAVFVAGMFLCSCCCAQKLVGRRFPDCSMKSRALRELTLSLRSSELPVRASFLVCEVMFVLRIVMT